MVLILGLIYDKGDWFSIYGNDLKFLMESEIKYTIDLKALSSMNILA